MRTSRWLAGRGLVAAALGLTALCGGCPGTFAAGEANAARNTPKSGLDGPQRISPRADTAVPPTVVNLAWTTVADATEYAVFLGGDTNPPLVAIVNGPSYLASDLPECSKQYWRVAAVIGDRQLSSVTWSFTTGCPGRN